MKFCSQCGARMEDASSFCTECGAPTAPAPDPQQTQILSQPGDQGYAQPYVQPAPPPYCPPYGNQDPYRPAFTPMSNGGMIAWSIVSILLCTIPGIVALVNACNIPKSTSQEEQDKALSKCKTWNIIACVLGGLSLIAAVINGLNA